MLLPRQQPRCVPRHSHTPVVLNRSAHTHSLNPKAECGVRTSFSPCTHGYSLCTSDTSVEPRSNLTAIWLLSSSTGFQGTTHNPQRGFKERFKFDRRPYLAPTCHALKHVHRPEQTTLGRRSVCTPTFYYPRQEPRRSLDATGILPHSFQHLTPRLAPSRRTLHFAYVSDCGASVEVREAMFAPPLTPSTSTSAPSRADPSCPPLCLCFRRWHVREVRGSNVRSSSHPPSSITPRATLSRMLDAAGA